MTTECRSKVYYATLLPVLLVAVFAIAGCANPEKAKIAHVQKGEAYLKEEKFQEASLEFRNAVQIDEKFAPAHWGLARAYEGLQRFQEAFDVGHALRLLIDPGRRDACHRQLDLEDVAGEAHAAEGGAEEIGVLLGRALHDGAVRYAHAQ